MVATTYAAMTCVPLFTLGDIVPEPVYSLPGDSVYSPNTRGAPESPSGGRTAARIVMLTEVSRGCRLKEEVNDRSILRSPCLIYHVYLISEGRNWLPLD